MAEQMVYTAEKSLADHKDAVTDDIKNAVTAAVEKVKTAKEGTDKAALDAATQELSAEMQKIGEHIAKNQPQPEGATPSSEAGSETPEENIRDVDTEEDK